MVAKILERPTRVLNRNWQPVNVATVARSLVLLWNESARVVDPHDFIAPESSQAQTIAHPRPAPQTSDQISATKPSG